MAGELCPFLERLDPGCFVSRITSSTIPDVIRYCAGRYCECPHYARLRAGAEEPAVLVGEKSSRGE